MDDQVKASVKALEEAVIPGETLSQPSSELLAIGRRVMSGLDALNNIEEAIKTSRWVTIVGLCQILAYANVNGDAEADITRWCEGQWTVITGRHPHNVLALQGMSKFRFRVFTDLRRFRTCLAPQGSTGSGINLRS